MPNALVDSAGNVSIYESSFLVFSNIPPSKVGAMVYTNNTSNIDAWVRPDVGLYWYNKDGKTSDEVISPTFGTGFKSTNIVAVDIESLGIYDDRTTKQNPIKLIYLPQRESGNKIISAYEMPRTVNDKGVLTGFYKMKNDRKEAQFNFTFDFINGDTHMNFLKQQGIYYFVSRINAKRSYLKEGEHLPFSPSDPRKRYRRETITSVGQDLTSKNVKLAVALDMSTPKWEPYSMQPFRLPGFEHDMWWGLVTMYGTSGDPNVADKQRTELALSNDGFNWRYLKPGAPFIDNGEDPTSDDYGCINIAKPVYKTKFDADTTKLYYFYAASNARHVSGRNPGISVATGNYGKIAAICAKDVQETFYSVHESSYHLPDLTPTYSFYNALYLGSDLYPRILSDVTEDPTGKTLNNMNSYAAVLIYVLDESKPNGLGDYICGSLGSSILGTTNVSDNYENVGFVRGGVDGNSKKCIFKYLEDLSKISPSKIISVKDLNRIPVVVQTILKNAKIYGIGFNVGKGATGPALDIASSTMAIPSGVWTFDKLRSGANQTEDFGRLPLSANETSPTNRVMGTIALKASVTSDTSDQTLIHIYSPDNNNCISITYSDGKFTYTLKKDGLPFAQMTISPPDGKTFIHHDVFVTVEAVKREYRKYGTDIDEQVTTFRVQCPDLNFEKIVPQPILWDWKHEEGKITESDKANARSFAFITFSSFTPDMTKITVGAEDETGAHRFLGNISKAQIADYLPLGKEDFW